MKKLATNLFIDGLVTDFHPLTAKNTTLTNALNATLVTVKGNEMVLLNDFGNIKIQYTENNELKYVQLKDGFIPVGIKEYGGIIYIASYKPEKRDLNNNIIEEGLCELGSFPSIPWSTTEGTPIPKETKIPLEYKYRPFHNLKEGNDFKDFTTNKLNFELTNPVNIEILSSYDGTVNLILNDDRNIPRLINSGFAITEDGQAFIPEKTDANTEYLEEHFDATTSLIKRVVEFPEIIYDGVLNAGNLAVGNYTLYFKYADADGNETDFIAQSGLVSIFKGKDSDPFSIDGGVEDMNSNKAMLFTIKSTDFSYPYIKVYYTRTSSAIDSDRIPQAYVIDKLFELKNVTEEEGGEKSVMITITGDEAKTSIPLSEINTSYFVSDTVKAQAQCLNMLFLGNVTTSENNYKLFEDVSLRIIPIGRKVKSETKIGYINPDSYLDTSVSIENKDKHIFNGEYYNTKNIYYNVGYWNEEYYRLGIVYVLEDDTKTPVFNIAGYELKWNSENEFSNRSLYEQYLTDFPIYQYCEGNEYEFLTIENNKIIIPAEPDIETEFNNKGVIHFDDRAENDSYLYNILVYLSSSVKAQLSLLKVKGFFIVRLKRIPTIACQGYTLPWDKEAKVPIMTYYGRRGGTFDSLPDLEATDFPGDANAEEFFQPKRRYFVESFLRQVGREETSHDDVQQWSLISDTYYSQLHYIPDWAIDAQMIGRNPEGEPNYVRSDTLLTRLSPLFMIVTYSEDPLEQENLIREEATAILSAVLSDIESYLNPNYEEIITHLLTLQGNNLYTTYLAAYDSLTEGKTIVAKGVASYNYSNIIGDAYDTVNSPLVDTDTWNTISPIEDYTYDWYNLLINESISFAGNYNDCIAKLNEIIDNIHDSTQTISWLADYMLAKDTELSQILSSVLYSNTITGELATEISPADEAYIPSGELGGYFTPSLGYSINGSRQLFVTDEFSFSRTHKSGTTYEVNNYHINRKFCYSSTNPNLFNRLSSVPTHLAKHYYDLYKYCDGKQLTAICPEFEVRQPYFNTLFTGSKFKVKYTSYQPGYLRQSNINIRRYYTDYATVGYYDGDDLIENKYLDMHANTGEEREFKIVSITDNVPVVAIDNTIFKSVIGSDMEAYRFAYINEEHCAYRNNYKKHYNGENGDSNDFNLVRGIYSPYLGIVSNKDEFKAVYGTKSNNEEYELDENNEPINIFNQCKIFNIYYDTPRDFKSALKIRGLDKSAYYAISDINKLESDDSILNVYRGDCFLCTFTHRLNRNFNDPTAPTNDHILDKFTWQKNYKPDTLDNDAVERLNRINRGDVNAVKLGSWVTIKIKSSYNLSIRSLDESHIQEKGVMGRARGFYPLQLASADGGFKIPNSYVINDAFGATLGELYENLMDAIYINTDYSNRVVYSDIDITSQFKNGYRIFKGGHTKDYTKQYGAITKLIERAGDIVCVFEHGVGLLKINEKAIAAESDGGLTYITANTVLPETPFIYSDMYGSQWAESVIKTPSGVIYGIDSARKKIWKLASNFTIISDFRIEEFLHNNLTIGETDILPYLGLKNIATHYNANKSDVMFTFYYKPFIMESTRNCDTGEIVYEKPKNFDKTEIAWNICYNEILDKFQTFYSWIPIASANIDNQFYSFDRLCSRELLVNLELLDWPISPDRESPKHQFPIKIPYLWKHGQFNGDKPLPTNWYGEQHPFEFEFIINEEIGVQKIFNNLVIISNKAEPESFHFTITGDSYEFSEDKPTMYYRLEATKELFNSLGSLINYDEEYTNLKSKLKRNPKSTILPLYYNRVNHYNDIYDIYTKMLDRTDSRDYSELSGTEVIWNKYLNEFELSTHIKNSPMESTNLATLRGNSRYKEDRWEVLIPSLNLMLKNEVWLNDVPPIVINPNVIASDLLNTVIERTGLPNTYAMGDIDTTGWTFRKQTKIRDKYCKVKIRYSGTKLAVISAIITTFTISYA